MTEDEAKKKWCPFAKSRAVITQLKEDETYICNMLGPKPSELSVLCIGSDCMAWRWDSDFNDLMARVPPPRDPREIADGHCGLAGPI